MSAVNGCATLADATAFADYYRCPDEFARFGISGEQSAGAGYFEYAGVTCFGRCAGANPVSHMNGNLPKTDGQTDRQSSA